MNIRDIPGAWESLSAADQARIVEAERLHEEAKRAALGERDWSRYFIYFDGHSRLPEFERVHHLMSETEYWEELREAWMLAEFALPDLQRWRRLLFMTRPVAGGIGMMNTRERRRFNQLSDELVVFRGQQSASHPLGFSWTLNRSRAAWFASKRGSKRMHLVTKGAWKKGPGVVFRGTIRKADVLCYLNGRKEDEVLVLPENVANVAHETK